MKERENRDFLQTKSYIYNEEMNKQTEIKWRVMFGTEGGGWS